MFRCPTACPQGHGVRLTILETSICSLAPMNGETQFIIYCKCEAYIISMIPFQSLTLKLKGKAMEYNTSAKHVFLLIYGNTIKHYLAGMVQV